MLLPSSLYCTLTIAADDDAVAVSRTPPVTVVLGAGDVIETDTAERLNVAVTVVFAFASTVHVPVPAQAPVHPPKADPLAGAAVSVTAAPLGNEAEQVAPQLMPAGALVTVPPPVPVFFAVRVYVETVAGVNVAVTPVDALTLTVQAPVPAHAPPHPAKVE